MLHHTHAHSPVAFADCKYCGSEFFHVDVRFPTAKDLDDLIAALQQLRTATDFDHVHLQDFGLSPSSPPSSAEMVFHQPGTAPDEDRVNWIQEAERKLSRG